MKIAFVFPGQGSQSVGMTAPLADSVAAMSVLERADAALGEPLTKLMAEGPAEDLNLTVNTQPAMLATSIAIYEAWLAAGGVKPALTAGHSLGEYSALTCAGVFTLEDAVCLVRYRAQVMQQAVPVGVGSMAAIIGLADDVVQACCVASRNGEVVEAVNFNSPGQVVIAGHKTAVERACEACKAAGAKRALMLSVSGPFHSQLLKGAAQKLAVRLSETAVAVPEFGVLANVNADYENDPAVIRSNLALQAASPVQWVKTVQKMKAEGVTHIVECGPGKVLSGLVRRIDPEIVTANINSTASIEALLSQEGFKA